MSTLKAVPPPTPQPTTTPVLSIPGLNLIWYAFGPKSEVLVPASQHDALNEVRAFALSQAQLHKDVQPAPPQPEVPKED